MNWKPKAQLTEQETSKSLRMILYDGLTSEALVCLSSGAVLVAIALSLGASNFEIGLLSAFPTLCNVAQIITILVLRKFPYRKLFTLLAVFLSRLPLIAVGLVMWFGESRTVSLLLLAIFVHYFFGSMGGAGWNSWVKDIVPEKGLGTYFGKRSRYMQIVNICLSLLVAFLIDYVQDNFPDKLQLLYAIYLALAGFIGVMGTLILSQAFETKVMMSQENIFHLLSQPLKNLNFRRLLWFNGFWSFSINLATPFFTVFMLQILGLSMVFVIILSVITQLFSVLTIRYWGNLSDRYSNKSIIFLSAPIYIACLLGWIFVGIYSKNFLNMGLLVLLHIVTGISTSGINLALTNIGLKLAPKQDAVIYISVKNIITSIFSALAPIIGGMMADIFLNRDLRITFEWLSPDFYKEIKLIYLHDWNFLFLIASGLSLFSLRFLAIVEENGEVSHYLVRKVLKTRFRQRMKDNIIIGNIGHVHDQIKAIVKRNENLSDPPIP
ncbi:MFS transporter [Sphingobacterium litopenaei]|uniref:MFS transporter n=1 Tax=Sphingobacterium litopenaei TaxID=2763500 RepID=A0ABR7YH23_9SPHI|nr:MFS transporter [Sphingobacterium litopenaei]MBD1430534.1 MFS transporter [Sphingobacterium litopenaei]